MPKSPAASDRSVQLWALFVSRFRFPLILLLSAIVYGTAGYMAVEGWGFLDALYMAVTTLTTVGFREVQPLSTGGRIFTITLTLFGVLVLFVAVAVVAQHLQSGELGDRLRRRRMSRRIDSLSDHYIVCAYGRVGRAVADELKQQGIPFVVIETQQELRRLMEERDIPYLTADPTQAAVLVRAGIERAKGLVCAVDSDAINVYITLTARALNPNLSIVSRSAAAEAAEQLRRAGADRVVSPYVLSGKRMAALAIQPSLVEFFDMVAAAPDLRIEEIEVRPGSPLDGVTVGEASGTHRDLTILAVKKRAAELIASPGHTLKLAADDVIIVLGPAPVLSELAQIR